MSDCHKGARFLSLDLKDFFLSSIMPHPEYMCIHQKFIPQDIINRYNLHSMFHNDYIYCEINKGVYGLPQAALLAYQQVCTHLKLSGYIPIDGTSRMFKHLTCPTILCLCVDDFEIKYFSTDDAHYLLTSLQSKYKYSVDWDGNNFCGLHYDWNYEKGFVNVSLPDYDQKTLKRLQHQPPKSPQYSPQHHIPIQYSTKGEQQFVTQPDDAPILSPTKARWVQSVVGSFLYYC